MTLFGPPPKQIGLVLTEQELRTMKHALKQFIRTEENHSYVGKAALRFYKLQDKLEGVKAE